MSVAPAPASRVFLRKVGYEDQDEFLELTGASAELHRPWISLPVTPGEFAAYVARFDQETAVGFLVCLCDTGAIAGIVNIGQIVRGSYQRA
ncbi:MAG TPA: GNAT family N-acetyltransferase, partial [Streptosporangiaceae bacterium]|nr:GNAT family N-acetyltransferase [Streptosporangiaceae bacterium]